MRFVDEMAMRVWVSGFVAAQNGRFREHCSDVFLTEVLMMRLREASRRTGKSLGGMALEGDENAAYEAGMPVFESILETACGAGINGHHYTHDFVEAVMTLYNRS
jgi:hypothetical protein